MSEIEIGKYVEKLKKNPLKQGKTRELKFETSPIFDSLSALHEHRSPLLIKLFSIQGCLFLNISYDNGKNW